MKNLLAQHKKNRKLTTLVENKSTYSSAYAELNIFETHQASEQVALKFQTPIIASMLTGRKVMHLAGMAAFDFLPGESVVLPANQEMIIDFPIATKANPTQCLALAISPEKILEVSQQFNQQVEIEKENNNWNLDQLSAHLVHQEDVNHLVNRLVYTFTHHAQSKDVLLDLMIQELIIRLLQTKAKHSILSNYLDIFSDTRIGSVIKYIKENLTNKDITIEDLAKKACLSTSHFHKKFKNTLGTSPIDYINSEKIKFAKKLMTTNKGYRVSEIALKSGFNNTSYFIRQFKKLEMMTPQQFKASINTSGTR